MDREKILSAISSAIGYLGNSSKLFSNKEDGETYNLVWRASSDVEYCLFLFSLLYPNEAESFSLKRESSSKHMEIQPILTSTLNMLEEAKSCIENDDFAMAHEKTWKARVHLFKVQKIFEKQRKIGTERSSTASS